MFKFLILLCNFRKVQIEIDSVLWKRRESQFKTSLQPRAIVFKLIARSNETLTFTASELPLNPNKNWLEHIQYPRVYMAHIAARNEKWIAFGILKGLWNLFWCFCSQLWLANEAKLIGWCKKRYDKKIKRDDVKNRWRKAFFTHIYSGFDMSTYWKCIRSQIRWKFLTFSTSKQTWKRWCSHCL